MFAKSIRENISLGAPGATQEQIEAAAKMANAHEFIMSFPEGYDTQVGDLGSQVRSHALLLFSPFLSTNYKLFFVTLSSLLYCFADEWGTETADINRFVKCWFAQ